MRFVVGPDLFHGLGKFLFQGILTMTPSVINSMLQTDMSEVIRIIVSNGMQHYCCRMDYANRSCTFLPDIPDYDKL